ncbi:hypothetical protein CSA56_16470 [candidate division KSB3 bacterium]|uniref:Uncharacterized protein n=1 Tax=candidate division KSB3 bacterium TaxID=2044937 RepID=A0A2G6KA05_9BACT|nr:MAG: hypothetical protein CSA56_16470 [candidate division KSB3 bacterium]
MKKHELINALASTLASKDDAANQKLHSTYISTVITLFATIEHLGFQIVPSQEDSEYTSEAMLEEIFNKWCNKFEMSPNWPDTISLEEKFDRYFLPKIHEYLIQIETDRESYQNRFYVMQWAFRKFFKTYGDVAKEFEYANIHFLTDDILGNLTKNDAL